MIISFDLSSDSNTLELSWNGSWWFLIPKPEPGARTWNGILDPLVSAEGHLYLSPSLDSFGYRSGISIWQMIVTNGDPLQSLHFSVLPTLWIHLANILGKRLRIKHVIPLSHAPPMSHHQQDKFPRFRYVAQNKRKSKTWGNGRGKQWAPIKLYNFFHHVNSTGSITQGAILQRSKCTWQDFIDGDKHTISCLGLIVLRPNRHVVPMYVWLSIRPPVSITAISPVLLRHTSWSDPPIL